VPASTIASYQLAELITSTVSDDAYYFQLHGLPRALVFAFSALASLVAYLTTLHLVRGDDGRLTGIEHPVWMEHSFLFISIGAWPLIFVAGAIMMLVALGV